MLVNRKSFFDGESAIVIVVDSVSTVGDAVIEKVNKSVYIF